MKVDILLYAIKKNIKKIQINRKGKNYEKKITIVIMCGECVYVN